MRRTIAFITAAVFSIAAVAQQPQQCVNPEMLDGLVFLGRSDAKISVARGEPAFMQGVRVPGNLLLIGSGVREGGSAMVAYKTSLNAEQAFAAVDAALGAQGWEVEGATGSTFTLAGGPKQETYCRNAERRNVVVSEASGARYINISAFPEARRRECNADSFMSAAMDRSAMPRFQFPEGTSVAAGAGSGGGSNTVYSGGSRILSREMPARLVELLAGQLESQGWRADANWQGGASAGSTWRKSVAGTPASGTLEIIRVSEGTYDVDFTIVLP